MERSERTAIRWSALDQDARVARAAREGFRFTALDEGAWVCETESGHAYRVTLTACDCPDSEYRCTSAGALCKHRIALNHHLLASGAVFAQEAAAREEALTALRRRKARMAKHARFYKLLGVR